MFLLCLATVTPCPSIQSSFLKEDSFSVSVSHCALFKPPQSFVCISSTLKLPYVHEMMKDNPVGNPMDSSDLPILDHAVILDSGDHCLLLSLPWFSLLENRDYFCKESPKNENIPFRLMSSFIIFIRKLWQIGVSALSSQFFSLLSVNTTNKIHWLNWVWYQIIHSFLSRSRYL